MNDPISFKHAGSPTCEPLHYTACGLDNVYLASGYQVREIGGERYVSVRDAEDLHKAIAGYLIRQKKVLAGKEIRFLRKHLELTQRELANWLGVSDQSVARYEKEQTALEGPTDGLFRLLVAAQVFGAVNVREELEHIREADDATSDTVTLQRDDDEWRVAA